MLEMHDASSLASVQEVAQWRGKQPVVPPCAPAGGGVRLQPPPEEEQAKDTIEQVILRRGSTRAFDTLTFEVGNHLRRQDFDGDQAVKVGITSLVDHTH